MSHPINFCYKPPRNIYKSDNIPPKYKYIQETCSVSRNEQVILYVIIIPYKSELRSSARSLIYNIIYNNILHIWGDYARFLTGVLAVISTGG